MTDNLSTNPVSDNTEVAQDPLHIRLQRMAPHAPERVLIDHYDTDEETGRQRLVGGSSIPVRPLIEEAATEITRLKAERDAMAEALADERAGAEILDEAGMDAGDKLAVVSAHLKELCEMVIHLDLVTTYGLRTKDYARKCEAALVKP